MSAQARKPYVIRSLDEAVGAYLSNLRIFVRRARESLAELEAVATEVNEKWPVPLGETVKDPTKHPELEKLAFKRDFLSDSVLIFSAMAVEGFLNFYGVVRLGEVEYKRNFERLSLDRKLRALLLFCDSIALDDTDPLIEVLTNLAKMRNSLVHPKTREVTGYLPAESRDGMRVPDAACQAVTNMDTFFKQFLIAVPEAKHLVPIPNPS
jgi:hypothetical protein